MAITLSKAKANIKRHYYNVYVRETGTAIQAADYADLSGWNTFLALFTAIGYCENENVKLDLDPADPVVVDEGEEITLGYEGNMEIKYLQSTPTDDAALKTDFDKSLDMLWVSTKTLKFMYFHNKNFKRGKRFNSGGLEHTLIQHKQGTPDDEGSDGYIYLTEAIPTS